MTKPKTKGNTHVYADDRRLQFELTGTMETKMEVECELRCGYGSYLCKFIVSQLNPNHEHGRLSTLCGQLCQLPIRFTTTGKGGS